MKKYLIALVLIPLFSSGCSMNFKEKREFADSYIALFKAGDYQKMYAMLDMDPKLWIPYSDFETFHTNLVNNLGAISGFTGPEVKIKLFGPIHIFYVYKIKFEKEWGMYILALSEKQGKYAIRSANCISATEAKGFINRELNKVPDFGVAGVIKRVVQQNANRK